MNTATSSDHHRQRLAPGDQVADVGFEPDAGEEIEQQIGLGVELERHLQVEREVEHRHHDRGQEPADHRLGEAVLAQHAERLSTTLPTNSRTIASVNETKLLIAMAALP